jgi:hypothetical protein
VRHSANRLYNPPWEAWKDSQLESRCLRRILLHDMVSLHMRKIHTEVNEISRGINLECRSWLKTPEARVTSLHIRTLKYWFAGVFGTWLGRGHSSLRLCIPEQFWLSELIKKESSRERILKANQISDLQKWSYLEIHHGMQCRSHGTWCYMTNHEDHST